MTRYAKIEGALKDDNMTTFSFGNEEVSIRGMHRKELDVLVDWAAAEGWNPGLHDAEVFWATDPDGFVAAQVRGQMVGGGSIVSYDGLYGFMGFFIVHPDYRGHGLGDWLWHRRLRLLRERLKESAAIGMDGVFDMQAYYARGGFRFDGRDLRFEGRARQHVQEGNLTELSEVPFNQLEEYDRAHFPAPRSQFLRHWISQSGTFGLAALRGGELSGYGVLRPCREGYKFGPLFAADQGIARNLFRGLCGKVPGEMVYLDVPENNAVAVNLAEEHDMREVFGCARMYFGPAPSLPKNEIFGVTTFELG